MGMKLIMGRQWLDCDCFCCSCSRFVDVCKLRGHKGWTLRILINQCPSAETTPSTNAPSALPLRKGENKRTHCSFTETQSSPPSAGFVPLLGKLQSMKEMVFCGYNYGRWVEDASCLQSDKSRRRPKWALLRDSVFICGMKCAEQCRPREGGKEPSLADCTIKCFLHFVARQVVIQ